MLCQCLNQSAKYRSSRCLEWVPVDLLRTLLDGCPAVATDQLTQSVYSDPALITALNTSANGPKINHQVSYRFFWPCWYQQRMFWILLSSLQKNSIMLLFLKSPAGTKVGWSISNWVMSLENIVFPTLLYINSLVNLSEFTLEKNKLTQFSKCQSLQ